MLEPATVNQAKNVNHKISSSSKKLSRVNSFAKEEDMERILEEVETGNLYSPSSKNAKKRPSVVDEDSQRPDEELEQFFLDVEKRNAELQELLQLVETTRQENEGQISREASAGVRGSTDSLVEKLMRDLENVGLGFFLNRFFLFTTILCGQIVRKVETGVNVLSLGWESSTSHSAN